MENDFTQLKREVQELKSKMDSFFDIYYRTNQIDKTELYNKLVIHNDIEISKNGSRIGTSANEKLGFYGATPVNQPNTVSDPSGGAVVDLQARTIISTIIDRLQELGLIG